MLITRLKLNYFGRFHDKEITLKPGINLIYGDNEAGKSTIHAFIRGMLFGIEKTRGRSAKPDIYSRYLPWDYPGAYGGSMDIRLADKDYRLTRSFLASDKSFSITDLSTGREVKLKEGLLSELIPGLTESNYRNTISIEQLKARTDAELAAELANYIANLSASKSRELDVGKALTTLKDKRKELMANDFKGRLQTLQEEIKVCIEKEEKMERLSLQYKELLAQEEKLRHQLEAAKSSVNSKEAERMNELPAILEKYKSYQEITGQLEQLKKRYMQLQEQIASVSDKLNQLSAERLEEDIRKAKDLEVDKERLLTRLHELDGRKESFRKALINGAFFTLLPFAVAAFAVMFMKAAIPKAEIIFCLLLAAGLASYAMLAALNSKKQKKARHSFDELNNRLLMLQSELEALLAKYRLPNAQMLELMQKELLRSQYELKNLKEQQDSISRTEGELEDKKDMLYETIMRYMQYFMHEDELSLEAVCRLQELILQKKQARDDYLATLAGRYTDCKLQIEKLKWEMNELEGNEKELLQKQELYGKLAQEQKDAKIELEAVNLAIETIEELAKDIHDSFGRQLSNAVAAVLSEITGGKYRQLAIDEKLDIRVVWKDDFKALDRLSAGTIDQIYFSLRLAVADLLLGREEMPLLLDDSFALYDNARIKAAISRISKRGQTILFTCHRREEAIIRELGLPCNVIDLTEY